MGGRQGRMIVQTDTKLTSGTHVRRVRTGLTPSRRSALAAGGWVGWRVRKDVESPATLPDLRQVAVELRGIGIMAPPILKEKQVFFCDGAPPRQRRIHTVAAYKCVRCLLDGIIACHTC